MPAIDWNALAEKLIAFIPPFEVRLIIVGVLVLILCAINVASLLHSRKKKTLDPQTHKKLLSHIPTQAQSGTKKTWTALWKNHHTVIKCNILVTFLCILIIGSMLFIRPIVIGTSPKVGATLASAQQAIGIEFDIPIDPEELTFNISPEVKGTWEFQRTVSALPIVRKATFHPTESFYPGSPVVIYITGIQTMSGTGKFHEQALEFRAPGIPSISSISPSPGSKDVKTDSPVIIEYDSPVGDFVETKIDIEPVTKFELLEEGNRQTISFPNGLLQDTHYSFKVYQTPRSYEISTGANIETGETKEIGQTGFDTVTTPGVSEYEPKGEGVLVTSPIKVTFDQNMSQPSVERHFTISPATEGSISWEALNTFVFTPKSGLQKETAYTVTFSKGMVSSTEGSTRDDIVISFTTVGRVNVSSITPVSGSYGVDPNSTNIAVTFDQSVDQASAQQHFSISPSAGGSFSWSGNTMTYGTAGALAFSTTYTITLSPGIVSVNGLDSTDTFTYTFSTRSNTFALNVPLYLMAPGFTCNLVSTKMVLAYRGVSVGIGDIQSGIGFGGDPNSSWVDGYGTHWGPVSQYISRYRRTTAKQGWTLSEMLTEVQNGNPVILFWYNRYSQPPGAFTLPSGATGYMGMHSEVVRGFVGSPDNPSAILVNDPWRGQLSYTPSLFMSTWAYIGYAGVVVY